MHGFLGEGGLVVGYGYSRVVGMVCWVYVGMEGGVEWVQGVTATPVITQMGKHFLSLNNAITQKPLSFTLKEIKVILGL